MDLMTDDPDVPCFTTNNWLKVDKNRYHQARGPGGLKNYVFNPNLWCYAFRDSLTSASVANEYEYPGNTIPGDGWMNKRGVVAITPRHVASCGHAPIGMSTPGYPSKVRFVGTDGETYERYLIGQKYCHPLYPGDAYGGTGYVSVNGVSHAIDSWIGTLNEDLPAEVHIARTIPNHPKFKDSYGQWDDLFVTQSTEGESWAPIGTRRQGAQWYPYNQPTYTYATAYTFHPQYPTYHRNMAVPNAWESRYGQQFLYHPWGGDSGRPLYYAYDTELLWAGFAAGGGYGPSGYPHTQGATTWDPGTTVITWEDLVTAMIDASDDDAIARGNLVARTGYRCVFANEIPDRLP